MLNKALLHILLRILIPIRIPVKKAIHTYRTAAEDIRAQRNVRLNAAAGSYAQKPQRALLLLNLPCGKIHIGKRIQLRNNNIYVIRTDSRRESRNSLSFVTACAGNKLPGTLHKLLCIKKRGDKFHSARVAHKQNIIRNILRLKVQVKYRSVRVYNKLRCSNLTHNYIKLNTTYKNRD